MAERPLGLKPIREREFNVVIIMPKEKLNRKERFNEWFYHVKNFSFGRGHTIEIDLEDDMIQFLEKNNWIVCRGGQYFFTKKGNSKLLRFAEQELAKHREKQ